MSNKISTQEATELVELLKNSIKRGAIAFPYTKGKITFDVKSEKDSKIFIINIDRKGIEASSCSYQGRLKSNNLILMRLDINPTGVHINPSSGERLDGSHLHIYTEEYEMKEAIPFDVNNKNLFQLCKDFFDKFNVTKPPRIEEQMYM